MTSRRLRIAVCIAASFAGVFAATSALADRLPVFNLQEPKAEQARSLEAAKRILGGGQVNQSQFAVTQRAGSRVFDIDKRSGAVFFGDMQQLWNPAARPSLPDSTKAKDFADRFLAANGLLPKTDGNISVVFSHVSETGGGNDVPGRVDKQIYGLQYNYRTEVKVRGANGDVSLPVVGGGARFQVTVGDRGQVIGYHGVWRSILGVASEEEIKPAAAAVQEVSRELGKTRLENVRTRLAYYASPGYQEQRVLAPVWLVDARIRVGNESVPIRTQIVAATKYGPVYKIERPSAPRDLKAPLPPAQPDDEGRSGKQGFLDLLFPPAHAANGFECGTSWIGQSQGLGGSAGNKQGFVNNCTAAGWSVNFDWGDANAWESDFRVNDDSYVDAADLVFYTGHASQNGWVLNMPDDTFLNFTEVAGAADLYGQNDLEWLIIAACGPLQSSHFVGSTTNAFDRWRPIFDGMHVLMGYGAVTFDNSDEGRRFMELTRAGWTVIDAWFRTAEEVQPGTNSEVAPDGPTIYVVAMYAHNGDHCARNDHLWGMGSTCADVPPGASQQRYMMWSGT